MRLSIPGTVPRRGPSLTSADLPLRPNTPYTFRGRIRTSGLTGPLTLYLIERGSDGGALQRGVNGPTGTSDWTEVDLTFTTGPLAATASFKAEVFSGSGTAWLDEVQLLDVFGGRAPVPFGGTVSSDEDGLTQTARVAGLDLRVRYTSVGSAIRVDATLTDSTGSDRAVEVEFRLPLQISGASWEHNLATSVLISPGTRYENLYTGFGAQTHSNYPFATVRSDEAAVSMAVPMGPQMQRFSYDSVSGFRSAWDLGLSPAATKTRSRAAFSFYIYTQAPRWGMRAAAEKYYELEPASFASNSSIEGSWTLASRDTLGRVANSQDFGWGFLLPSNMGTLADSKGLATLHYVDPVGWFRNFPEYRGSTTPPPYGALVGALVSDAETGTGVTVDGTPINEMAQATINSSPFDPSGLYQVFANSYFWYGKRLHIYPVSPDPDIPAPSMWSVVKKYRVDTKLGGTTDGIFLDDITATFGNVENHRRSLWAHSDLPLSFSYTSRKVVLYDGFSIGEFCTGMSAYLHSEGLVQAASINPGSYVWFAASQDMLGGEAEGAETADRAYLRRTLGYSKPWSNLLVNDTTSDAADAATVLKYLRQALLLGYFPGAAGEYWNSPAAYERDRPLWKKYIPLIRKIVEAGWKPIPYATSSDPGVLLERFDRGSESPFYLTAQNSGGGSSTFQITLEGASLGLIEGDVVVKDLVTNWTVPAIRSGPDVRLMAGLGPGETALYEITSPRSTSRRPEGRPRDSRVVRRP